MNEDYILTSLELCQLLGISTNEFITLEDQMGVYPSGLLIENQDYRIVIKSKGLRDYSEKGAYSLISYYFKEINADSMIDFNKKWQEIKGFIAQRRIDIQLAFVGDHIFTHCCSLVKRSDLFFIAESDLVVIFKTTRRYLREAFTEAGRSDITILVEDIDYSDNISESERYYSMTGTGKLATVMSNRLTREERRRWCEQVDDLFPDTINKIIHQIDQRWKRIEGIKNKVKAQAQNICQVTGNKQNKLDGDSLAAHHLYDQATYPQLADVETNLLVIKQEIHKRFHDQYMKGTKKGCTINDFIRFIKINYPKCNECLNILNYRRLVLGKPEPIGKRTPSHIQLRLPVV
jgi:hypothetical protein